MARRVLETLLVVLACLSSGTLECGRPALSPAASRGAETYARMCSVCHGKNGEGYVADEATALQHQAFLASVTDEYLKAAITDGRRDTTMSAWGTARGGPLSSSDVNDVVAFLRSWQRVPRETLDERPLSGNKERGSPLFQKHCSKCHGIDGVSGPNVHVADADLLRTATNGFLRLAIRSGRPGTSMPAFEAPLGDDGVEDVVALIRSWAPKTTRPSTPAARPPPLPLGPVPLNPKGPEPRGFKTHPLRTSMNVVKPEIDRGARMALLDARTPSDYTHAHIPGAVSVPFYDVDRFAPQLPKDAWLVCYCSCPHAESGMLAASLVDKGFKKVTVLEEGLRGWNAQKWPTHEGEKP